MLAGQMRVLLVSHLFPPRHSGGTELYTAELARRLVDAGLEVHVLTTAKDVSRAQLSLRLEQRAGYCVHELVNNLYYRNFRETWRSPAVEHCFADLLDRLRPDVVHFQHLMYLSAGCLEQAARRHLRVVFTLHDFWLECPRFGQLVHADGTLCERVDPLRCGSCLPTFKWRQSALERSSGRLLAWLRGATGVNAASLAQRAVASMKRVRPKSQVAAEPRAEEVETYAEAVRERSRELLSLAVGNVDAFLAPSRFLEQRMLAFGIPPERLRYLPTGIDQSIAAPPPARAHQIPLRLRFFGTLVPLKGAHILLQAWARLDHTLRQRAQLVLYGSRSHAPDYQVELERLAQASGARLAGQLAHADVARELSSADLCIVPSTWFENRPLIVLEALQMRTPLLVSDTGALAELVVEGVAGWRFARADVQALSERLARIISHPEELRALYPGAIDLPSWEDTLRGTLAAYRAPSRE